MHVNENPNKGGVVNNIGHESKFPVLTREEAEEIVQELGKALDAHREWTGKFRNMLVCRTKPTPSLLKPTSHKKTIFGRWYYGTVNQHLRVHPDFAIVGKNSKIMHNLARKLAQTVLDKKKIKPSLYNSFVKSVDNFRLSVRTLLSEAWDYLRFTDPLTGVMTRTAMKARLEEEKERSRRNHQLCCIGIMDLDKFKIINDTYGHQAGDTILSSVAKYVNNHLRDYDQIFRYGGEEFLLLLPNSSLNTVTRVLNRLRQGINKTTTTIESGEKISISASFGISELQTEQPTKVSIEQADKALFEAKNAGRNKVCVWHAE